MRSCWPRARWMPALARAEQARLLTRHDEVRERALHALRRLVATVDLAQPGRSGLRPAAEAEVDSVLRAVQCRGFLNDPEPA